VQLVNALNAASTNMKSLFDEIERGIYPLDPNGQPTRKGLKAIQRIVDDAIPDDESSEEVLAFKKYFEEHLTEWFITVREDSLKDATDRLRDALLSYRPK